MRDAEHRRAIAGPTGDFPAILRAMETGLTPAEVLERVAQGFEGLGALILRNRGAGRMIRAGWAGAVCLFSGEQR
jgi:hypothetical protein